MAAGDDGRSQTLTSGESRDVPATPVRRVGQFSLIEVIGAGGMGTVWRARDEILHRDVAVKLLPPARAVSVEARSRMLREARAQASLNHPNICTIHQAGEDADGVWIAMELLSGPTLAARLADAPLAPALVASWAEQIARALMAAHARGLVHRDLKPGNVMLDAAGRAKVMDFGLVKLVDTAPSGDDSTASPGFGTDLTSAGAIMGSPRYMSPEQARGATVGPPSDVFSLGIAMYELLTGAPPFVGVTAMETMAAIMRDTPRPLRELAPSVPPALADIVHACLARDEAARPTASAVVERLTAPVPSSTGRGARIAMISIAAIALAAVIVASRGGSDATPASSPRSSPLFSAPARPTPAPTEITLVDKDADAMAAYDPTGRYLFFITQGSGGRLWRSIDSGSPQAVPAPALS